MVPILVASTPAHASRLREVEAAFRTLPERYLGAAPGFDATYHVRLGDVGHTFKEVGEGNTPGKRLVIELAAPTYLAHVREPHVPHLN